MTLSVQPVNITLRVAADADGPALGRLYAACDRAHPDVDWQQPGIGQFWWLVACESGELAGGIRVLPLKPWGWIADVLVHPDAREGPAVGQPSDVTSLLFTTAFACLIRAGITEARGVVDAERESWQRLLRRYGGTDLGPCRRFGRRLDV